MKARDHEIVIEIGTPRRHNAITDVEGVLVGHATVIEGTGNRQPGVGPVRTGVTLVLPHETIWAKSVFAGVDRINGNGEVTGLE